MQTDYKSIKKQFEKSMNDYDKNALVQETMASKMVNAVNQIKKDFNTILELGAGTGLATKKIVESFKFENYYANDLVEKSKNYVKKIIPNAKFICANATKIKITQKADLIISNAMFQWFEDLEKAIIQIKRLMANEAILAFSTFSPENFKQIKDITGLTLNYKTSEEIKNILNQNGFEVFYCEQFKQELEFDNPLQLLAHMKKTGVNSLSEKVWTVKKVKDFCDRYKKLYPSTKITYSPIIVIAKLNSN